MRRRWSFKFIAFLHLIFWYNPPLHRRVPGEDVQGDSLCRAVRGGEGELPADLPGRGAKKGGHEVAGSAARPAGSSQVHK